MKIRFRKLPGSRLNAQDNVQWNIFDRVELLSIAFGWSAIFPISPALSLPLHLFHIVSTESFFSELKSIMAIYKLNFSWIGCFRLAVFLSSSYLANFSAPHCHIHFGSESEIIICVEHSQQQRLKCELMRLPNKHYGPWSLVWRHLQRMAFKGNFPFSSFSLPLFKWFE